MTYFQKLVFTYNLKYSTYITKLWSPAVLRYLVGSACSVSYQEFDGGLISLVSVGSVDRLVPYTLA